MVNDYVRNAKLTIGTSSVKVADARNPRKSIILRNASSGGQIITLNAGELPAVANEGFSMNPGDFLSDSTSEGYVCYQGMYTAIADGAGAILSIMER